MSMLSPSDWGYDHDPNCGESALVPVDQTANNQVANNAATSAEAAKIAA